MLTGRPPFIAQGGGEIVGMHQFVAPPDVRTLRADVPEPLAQLIMRALAKHPDERIASMHDFALALGPFAVQGVHTLPRGQGVTQLTAPPAVTTYTSSRGQITAQPRPASRALTVVFGVLALLSLTSLAIVVTCRGAGTSAGVHSDAGVPFEAGDRVAMLRAATKRAIAKRDWTDAQIAVQKWLDTANDAEAQEHQRRVSDESAAERAFADLTSASQDKRHVDGVQAFDRIPVSSVYRDQAIEIMTRLRKDYIKKKTVTAKELAVARKCKELGELQIEAQRFGADALNAVTSGIQCVAVPSP
jgi:hypothetical protein